MEIPEGLPVRWQSIRERIWPKFKQYSPMLVPIRKLWNKGNRKWIKAITRPFVRFVDYVLLVHDLQDRIHTGGHLFLYRKQGGSIPSIASAARLTAPLGPALDQGTLNKAGGKQGVRAAAGLIDDKHLDSADPFEPVIRVQQEEHRNCLRGTDSS